MDIAVRPSVFLSGGFYTQWQQKVIDICGDCFVYFNPLEHRLKDANDYTAWDIYHVKKCDIFFGYMESTNPSGYGLAFELGIALALDKTIILVDEKSCYDEKFARFFKMLHISSNVVKESLDEGILYLKSYSLK